jgi:hypothetical protein
MRCLQPSASLLHSLILSSYRKDLDFSNEAILFKKIINIMQRSHF